MKLALGRLGSAGNRTLIQRAIASLRARGSDAHLWLPGGDVRTYGPELVVNGGFDSDTVWQKQAGWTISGGYAIASGITGAIIYQAIGSAGKTYSIVFTVTSISGGNSRMRAYAGGTYSGFTGTTGGTYSVDVVCGSSNMWIGVSGDANSIQIDNISVREITSITPTITSGLTTGNYLESTGNTLATVDNPTGLVLDALGSVGSELVTNGGFDSDTGWSKPAGVVISSGVLSASASTSYCYRLDGVFTAGKTYKVTYEVKTYTSGTVKAYINSSIVLGAGFSSAGVHQDYLVATNSTGELGLFFSSAFTGTIDNISVREVTGIHLTQGTTANKGLLKQDAGSRYYWLFDATDLLTGTFPAGYESVTVIDAKSTGQVTTSAANVVGSYSIGPSYSSYGRIIIKGSITASELALYQGFANRLAGL